MSMIAALLLPAPGPEHSHLLWHVPHYPNPHLNHFHQLCHHGLILTSSRTSLLADVSSTCSTSPSLDPSRTLWLPEAWRSGQTGLGTFFSFLSFCLSQTYSNQIPKLKMEFSADAIFQNVHCCHSSCLLRCCFTTFLSMLRFTTIF